MHRGRTDKVNRLLGAGVEVNAMKWESDRLRLRGADSLWEWPLDWTLKGVGQLVEGILNDATRGKEIVGEVDVLP